MAGKICQTEWHTCQPTFMIDGVVAPKMSSGDNIEKWISELENFTK